MLRYRHAAALIVGTFLIFPTLSSAQEVVLDEFDISVVVDVPDVGAHVPEFTDFNDSDPGIASGISEALVTTAAGIVEEVGDDAQLHNIDLQNIPQQQQQLLQTMSNVSKALHDTAMAIIRKIGGAIPDPAQYGDPKEDIEKTFGP